MEQLIAHLIGDFVLQNQWMADNKPKNSFACAVHVALYAIPFLFLTRSPWALAVILGTHFVIDRFRLAKYWVAFWGIGCEGFATYYVRFLRSDHGIATFNAKEASSDPSKNAEPYMAVWLLIINDNAAHLLLNFLALRFLA